MRAIRAIRVHEDSINTSNGETIYAVTYTDDSYTFNFVLGENKFPKAIKMSKDMADNQYQEVLDQKGVILWMVVADSYFKGESMDRGINIPWIQFIGTSAECCKFIERNEKLSPRVASTESKFGGVRKVYDKAPKATSAITKAQMEEVPDYQDLVE